LLIVYGATGRTQKSNYPPLVAGPELVKTPTTKKTAFLISKTNRGLAEGGGLFKGASVKDVVGDNVAIVKQEVI